MFQLYLLGNFRLECDGVEVRLPAQKSKALLAYLALYPQAHPREQLAALFWGDSSDRDARKSLRVAFQHLYKALGKEFFNGDYETVQLAPDANLWVDAVSISRLANRHAPNDNLAISDLLTAIGEYRGELLAGFYDDWILKAREEYRELYVELLLQIVESYRAQSEYAQASEYAQKALQTDRANERAHQHLIFLYAAQGDRSAALKQFEICVAALDEELGVEPSAETIALAKKIKQQKTGALSDVTRLTNLPKPPTSFVGREREIADIRQILTTERRPQKTKLSPPSSALVTLIGAGGSGKTRLAIESGRALADEFEHGVWWVELAPLSDAALVPQAVAKALGVAEQPNESLTETLVNFLRERELLFILDNCEHLVDACAQLANHLITQAPKLSILATSREGLNIPGEQVYPVAPLTVPRAQQISLASLAMEFSAVRLFVERARLASPQFVLDDANASDVIHICQRLDGIPLALELAAARVKQLGARDLAAQLDRKFEFLIGARTALPRQQTLRALIDWSYDLLNDEERVLFQRLSVFAGGWTLDAAQEICADKALPQTQILNVLLQLVSKSLVQAETAADSTRYRMLETVREYAREKLVPNEGEGLDATGETTFWRAQHLAFFLRMAESADTRWVQGESEQFKQLDVETDNLRVALETAFAEKNARAVLRLTGALADYWYVRGNAKEGSAYLERALQLPQQEISPEILGKAYTGAGTLAWVRGDVEVALPLHQSAFDFYRAADDQRGMGNALHNIGVMHSLRGDYLRAKMEEEKALAIITALHDYRLRAHILISLGVAEDNLGNLAGSQDYYEQAAAVARTYQHQDTLAYALSNLGELARKQGDFPRALALIDEAQWLAQQIGHTFLLHANWLEKGRLYLGMGERENARTCFLETLIETSGTQEKRTTLRAVEGLAVCCAQQGMKLAAVRLFAAAECLRKGAGIAWQPDEAREYGGRIESLRAGMERERFDAAWTVGEALTMEQAVALAVQPVELTGNEL